MKGNETAQRAAVVAEARTWLRTTYHHHARVKGAGVDCAQLPAAVYEAAGLIPKIEPAYLHDWHLHHSEELYLQWIEKFAHRIDEADAGPGDLVVWKFGRTYSHAGIITEYPEVIHAWIDQGVTTDNINQHEELRTRPRLFYSLWGA